MSPTARPTESSTGNEHDARQDRRLLLVLVVIILGGAAAMAILSLGTA